MNELAVIILALLIEACLALIGIAFTTPPSPRYQNFDDDLRELDQYHSSMHTGSLHPMSHIDGMGWEDDDGANH